MTSIINSNNLSSKPDLKPSIPSLKKNNFLSSKALHYQSMTNIRIQQQQSAENNCQQNDQTNADLEEERSRLSVKINVPREKSDKRFWEQRQSRISSNNAEIQDYQNPKYLHIKYEYPAQLKLDQLKDTLEKIKSMKALKPAQRNRSKSFMPQKRPDEPIKNDTGIGHRKGKDTKVQSQKMEKKQQKTVGDNKKSSKTGVKPEKLSSTRSSGSSMKSSVKSNEKKQQTKGFIMQNLVKLGFIVAFLFIIFKLLI